MAVVAVDFDLQCHSQHSDGALSVDDVVELAADSGMRVLSLTDHDTVSGVGAAIAAGRRLGVLVIPGVEISALDPEGEDLHILGYGIDYKDARLRAQLARFRADRDARGERMIAALREDGFTVDERVFAGRRAEGRPLGRPHIAAAVYEHPANAKRLATEGLDTFSAVLVAYLTPGGAAYRTRTLPTVKVAIETIHAAGGLAVWGHPFWDIAAPQTVIATLERFCTYGLDGVEAFYATFNAEQTAILVSAARRLGLVTTASADFHGPDHPIFHRFGAFNVYGFTPEFGRLLPGAGVAVP